MTDRTNRSNLPYLLMSALLVVDTTVFVIEKIASDRADGAGLAFYLSLLSRPWVWISLALGLVQLWTWTRILARVDISLAYPITSLSYPVTMLAGTILLGERLPLQVWLGGLLIAAGVLYMGAARPPEPATLPLPAEPAQDPSAAKGVTA